jgi:hypothetical protein
MFCKKMTIPSTLFEKPMNVVKVTESIMALYIFFGILLYHARWRYCLITSMMAADEKAATKVSGKFLQYCSTLFEKPMNVVKVTESQ